MGLLFSNSGTAATTFGLRRVRTDSAQWVGHPPLLTISFVPFRAVGRAHFLVRGHNLRQSDAFAEQPVSPGATLPRDGTVRVNCLSVSALGGGARLGARRLIRRAIGRVVLLARAVEALPRRARHLIELQLLPIGPLAVEQQPAVKVAVEPVSLDGRFPPNTSM
jgi:hypothetical protein